MSRRLCTLIPCLVLLSLLSLLLTACSSAGEGEATLPDTAADTGTKPAAPQSDTEPAGTETLPESAPATETATEAESLSLEGYLRGDDITIVPTQTAAHPLKQLTLCGHDVSAGGMAIVIDNNPDETEVEAADLIAKWIREAVGVELPVKKLKKADEYPFRLYIGHTEADTAAVKAGREALSPEGYLLLSDGGQLYLTGSTPRGTRNGAVCFLEDYVGVRFFAADCEAVLPADAREVPADVSVSYSPAFDFRCAYYIFADKEYDKLHKLHPVDYAVGMRVHTLFYLAEMTGEANGHQPCLTDETVYRTVLGHVREWLAANPNATAVSVSQNDSANEQQLGCQCAGCKALNKQYGTEGGALFAFVNRIAADIRDDYPDVMVETLAYQYSINPPKDFVFEDNVLVQLCFIDTCFAHRLDDKTCSINKHYSDALEAWSRVCEHISIWDYHTNFNYYVSFFPNEEILYDHITYYASHHVVSVFDEGNDNSLAGNFEELRAYVCSQLLWNPDMTREQYDAMIDEFMAYYYGDGWPYLRRMLDNVTAHARGDGHHFNIWDAPDKVLPFNGRSAEDVAFAGGNVILCDRALEAAASDTQKAHVRKASVQAYYYNQYVNGRKKSDENTARNRVLYERIREAGITAVGAWTPLPEVKDFTVSPAKW